MRSINTLIIILSFTILISLTIFVYAAGSSEIPQPQPTPTPKPASTNSFSASDEPPVRNKECDSIPQLKERILCRLENNKEGIKEQVDYEKQIPEACKTLKNPTSCISLYKKVQENKCYDLQGKEKDKCFKDIVGIKKKLAEENDKANKARQYLILLLYDLEERVENAVEEDKIVPNSGAKIITLIIEAKQLILDNKPKSEIVSKLNELKEEWGSLNI